MEPVAAGLDAHDHQRARIASELGRVVAGLDLELGNGVERGHHHLHLAILHAHDVVVIVDAIDDEAVLREGLAVGVETAVAIAPARIGRDARAQPGKLLKIPAVQGQLANLVLFDYFGE